MITELHRAMNCTHRAITALLHANHCRITRANYAMRLITSAKPRTPSAQLRSDLSWMSLQDRREMQVVMKVHSCLHGRAPAYLCSKFSRNLNAEYRETRGANNIQLQCPRTNFYRKSFEFNGAYLWNKLPRALKSIRTRETFKQALWERLLKSK